MKNIILLSLILLLLISASCNTTEPPSNTTITLKLEDVSCTEAWITLTTANIQLPAAITLKQYKPTGDTVTKNIILSNEDSLLFIDSLLPNQTYKFITTIEQSKNKSNELSVTTLDTTSHNFTFQSWTFGTIGNSVLYDVAIINENNIWAVGEIYVADTSINGYTKYNAVHWNGNNWDLKRIPIDLNGYPFYPVIRSVFAFKENDIWFEAGIHWDGISFKQIPFNLQWSGNVNKLWGSSSSDLYAVGNNGNIARYYNGQWSRIETGTDINFRDIYGSINKDNNEVEIIALASNSGINQRKKIVRIKDQIVETLPDSGLADYLSTLWFISGRKYCIGGQGYYESETFGPVWERDDTKPPFHITTIRGAGLNDIALGGSFGLLMHYNGVNWINYAYITASYFDVITEVAIKGNTIVAAGFKGIKAVVMIGKR